MSLLATWTPLTKILAYILQFVPLVALIHETDKEPAVSDRLADDVTANDDDIFLPPY